MLRAFLLLLLVEPGGVLLEGLLSLLVGAVLEGLHLLGTKELSEDVVPGRSWQYAHRRVVKLRSSDRHDLLLKLGLDVLTRLHDLDRPLAIRAAVVLQFILHLLVEVQQQHRDPRDLRAVILLASLAEDAALLSNLVVGLPKELLAGVVALLEEVVCALVLLLFDVELAELFLGVGDGETLGTENLLAEVEGTLVLLDGTRWSAELDEVGCDVVETVGCGTRLLGSVLIKDMLGLDVAGQAFEIELLLVVVASNHEEGISDL